jgi:Protein of unknown function (DUF2380)
MKLMLSLLLAVSAPVAAKASEPVPVAVFDFELIDTSLQGEIAGAQEEEAARLDMLTQQLRDAFDAASRYRTVDMAPVAAEARAQNLQACGGCDRRLAEQVGAALAVTGTVQKVSNLILNINIYVREVANDGPGRAMSADIRGNTDESWRRGLDWLIRNRLDLAG